MVAHKNLTGTNLHEPKGADSAAVYSTYVSDGAGSGSWVVLRNIGEVQDYVGTSAPTGWLICNGKTIGNASSGGTARANADTSALFTLLWNAASTDKNLGIYDSGGSASTYGASAAADFAANKRLALPDIRGRVTAGYDDLANVSRLTNQLNDNQMFDVGGDEEHTLTESQLASHDHGNGSLYAASHSHSNGSLNVTGVGNSLGVSSSKRTNNQGNQDVNYSLNTTTKQVGGSTAASGNLGIGGSTSNAGGGNAHNNTQPTFILNKIIYYGA